jgi:hypothetical protein
MALTKGTNSYVTVDEANTYFADRIDVAAWTAATDTQKAQALVTATKIFNDMSWNGVAVSESQPLAFPRIGFYFDPRVGSNIRLQDTLPTRILEATFELAYHLLNNDGILDDTGRTIGLNVGSISMSKILPPSTVPSTVRRIIKPLLQNGGASSWWRAN